MTSWWPPQAPRGPSSVPEGDRILLACIVCASVVAAAVLATGHVSALVVDGSWPRYRAAEIPLVLWEVASQPGNPGRAWDRVTVGGGQPPGPVAWWATFGLLIAVVGAPVGLGVRRAAHRRTSEGAPWATRRRMRRLRVRGSDSGRLIVGRTGTALAAVESRHSLLIFGPTQSGKTTGPAIPAILEWPGPVVATSTKADLVDDTIGWRSRRGEVRIFDPAHSKPSNSATASSTNRSRRNVVLRTAAPLGVPTLAATTLHPQAASATRAAGA
jgi:type IV secretion system protein VirD4